jgi:NAD(P)-dependent dehydrogenase (short-subunit alcohol dehydrogenase family)
VKSGEALPFNLVTHHMSLVTENATWRRLGIFAGAGLAIWAMARALRNNFSFADKSVLITGGSRGLGFVIARFLSAEGARVALLARDANELARAREQINKAGGEAITIVCDLLDRTQAESAVEKVVNRFGTIDVLINNAGIIEIGPLAHMQREDFERSMNLHFWAPFNLMRKVVPHMRRAGGGRIVNISSIGGKLAVPHMAPYSAGKFALVGLSDSIRTELALDNIHVTTVTPGLMRTGSHVNAKFKGDHAAEYAWFSLAATLPIASISDKRAAAKIIAACRLGQPALIMPLPARIGIAGNAVFPNLTGYAMKLVNRFLPRPTNASGNQIRSGFELSRKKDESWLAGLTGRMTRQNNEP